MGLIITRQTQKHGQPNSKLLANNSHCLKWLPHYNVHI